MLFFTSYKKKKRNNINRMRLVLNVVSFVLIAACSHTPPKQPSTSSVTKPAPINQASSISAVLNTPESNSNNQLDRLYTSNSGTIWERLRKGYQLDRNLDHPAIDKEIKWYRSNPTFVYRTSERSSRYIHYIVSAVEQRNMPAELALLPFIESAYDPFAYSRSGAAGLWQFVPQTATNFGLKRSWWYDGRKDVLASTDAALTYLQYLHDKFDGDWLLAVAAYNFGEGSIQRAIEANRKRGLPTDFWSLSVRDETRTYVPRLLALAKIVASPHSYGINLYAIPNEAYFAAVDTKGQLQLSKAADLANVDVDELYRLNPGLHHGAIDPKGPQRLLLPKDAVDRFTRQLASLPADQRAPAGKKYEVAKGDTLASIARKFNVDASAIGKANQLDGALLRPGQSLLIPSSETTVADNAPASIDTRTPFGATQVFHTVQAGENLRRVAQQYQVSVNDIQRWNGLGPNDPIKLGQKLNIWSGRADLAATSPKAKSPQQKVGYTVKNGDSLTAIADKFNVEIEDILRWNQVNPRSLLQPGQRLTLFLSK